MNSQFDIHSSPNNFGQPLENSSIKNSKQAQIPEKSADFHSKVIEKFENLNVSLLADNEYSFTARSDFDTSIVDKVNVVSLNTLSVNEDDELEAILNEKEVGSTLRIEGKAIAVEGKAIAVEGEIATQEGQLKEKVADSKESASKEEKAETAEKITVAREFKFQTHTKEEFGALTQQLENLLKENDVAFVDPAGRQLHDVLRETFENILQDFSINDQPSKIFQECVSRLANNGQLVKKEADGTSRALNETEIVNFTQQIELIFGNYLLDQLQSWFKQEENKNQVIENKPKAELNSSYKQLEKYARSHEPLSPEAKKTLEKLIHTKLYANALQFGEIIKKLLEANKKDREIQAEIRAIERKFEILKKEILRWELLSEVKKSDDLKQDVSRSDLKGKVWRPVGDLISLHKATAAIAA